MLAIGMALVNFGQTYTVTLTFTPDCWGDESAWTLEDSDDNVVASAAEGTYSLSTPDGTGSFTYDYDLTANECYDFTITDAWGDGMAGGSMYWGCSVDGDFEFTNSGNVLSELDDPDFGASGTWSFCVTPGCTDSGATNYDASANVDDGSCTFSPPTAAFTYVASSPSCGTASVVFTNTSIAGTSYSWTFNQGTPATSALENPTVTFPSGGTYKAELTATNGQGSNTTSQDITIALDDGGNEITFVLDPDCWASETGWSLADSDGNVLYSVAAGTYSDQYPTYDDEIRTTFCLNDGCYDLTITDTYGDGLDGDWTWSCDEDGDYWFEDGDGNVIHNFSADPDFGYSYEDEVCIDLQFVWTGAFDDDWTNTGNWTGGSVPGSNDDVVIATTGSNPHLTSNKTVNNVWFNEGTSISFSAASKTLNVKGDFVNNGTIDLTKGQFQFKGNKLQYIKGNTPTFYKLKINTTDSVRILSDINLRGPLIPQKGKFDFNDKVVTLISEEDYTGSIGEIKSNAEIIGDQITMQRYFPAGPGSWRMLCTPITDATFEQWNDDLVTTGFEGSDYPNYPSAENPWSNVRYYDETFASGQASDLDSGFVSVGNITDIIGNTLGYFVYLVPEPTTVDVTGTFEKGDKAFSLDFTESNTIDFNDGWNLVANPYPSAIDWDDAGGWSTSDLDNAIYAYDPVNGQYSSYVNGISVGSLTNQIASSQAFWVKSESGSPAMDIGEKAKVNSTGVHLRAEDMNTVATIRLRLTGEEQWDETVIGFNNNSSSAFDAQYDAYKFYASNEDLPNLASAADSAAELSVNLIPVPEQEIGIDLHVKKGAHTDLVLSNEFVDTYDENICLVLEDTELGVFESFEEGDTYAFTMGEESLETRFTLHISAPLQASITHESCMDAHDGALVAEGFGSAPWTFIWKNEDGEIIQETTDSYTEDTMDNLAPGFYEIVVMNTSEHCNVANKFVEVEPAMEEAMAAQVEHIACEGENNAEIEVNLDQEYSYDLVLTNIDDGSEIEIENQFSDTTLTGLAAATYSLTATSQCGNTVTAPFLNALSPQSVEAAFEMEDPSINLAYNESAVFYNTSSNSLSFTWDFGDGSVDSVSVDPVHFYSAQGNYVVTLTASNATCSQSIQHTVEVYMQVEDTETDGDENSLHNIDWDNVLNVYYDQDAVILSSTKVVETEVVISVFNGAGQLVIEERTDGLGGTPIEIRTTHLAQGAFYINVTAEDAMLHSDKFIKK